MGYENLEIVSNLYNEEDASRKEKEIHRKGLFVREEWDNKYYDFIIQNEIKAIYLNTAKGWKGSDYFFLSKLKTIEELHIISSEGKNLSSIESMINLKELSIACYTKDEINFRKLKKLEKCYLSWWKKSSSIMECISLKDLYIDEVKLKDLSKIVTLINLNKLTIANSTVESIEWIDKLENLKELSFLNCKKIKDFSPISNLKFLKRLTIDGCKLLTDLDFIKSLKNLEIINISNNGEMKSIKPLSELKELKSIAFFGSSNINDGDLSSLEILPKLAMLGFSGRRHYSHKLIKEWNWNNLDIPSKLLEKV